MFSCVLCMLPCRCRLQNLICKLGRMMLFLILSLPPKFTTLPCLELVLCTLFLPCETWNRLCWRGKYSALSSIIALFWSQCATFRRRLKLIPALFRQMSSSGNSKPMQIAERRSHEGIRWLSAIYLGWLLNSSECIRQVDNESKQRQDRFLFALQRACVAYSLLISLKYFYMHVTYV